MSNEKVIKKAKEIIKNHPIGVLATVESNAPHIRYMAFYCEDSEGFTLYSATKKNTEKVEEIEENGHTSILLGYTGKGLNDEYIEVKGHCRVSEDEEIKKKIWQDSFSRWFEGPEDPNYVILAITPQTIRFLNNEHQQTEEVTI
ncbi:pyridoxamine 5'-phosphate oxidase family protein [Cytobacillus kochii]|uniref:pyridoxamine 5'-phosphate oxidase family protein n=1 Tax=Cytobacillus kochii TaxID=859143 RepID=UPI001CD5DBAA|nr:pyridoxamine 5'-phosphate oxidase family protein [Cytobacillus kochii]MCA1024599.1 pyridoxamine 5'-phosphate oxidase family protein [Cytobacillus kochii]